MSPGTLATTVAFLGAALAAWGVAELALAGVPTVRVRGSGALRSLVALWDLVVRVGRDGRDPAAADRRRLLASGAVVALCGGTVVAGPLAGTALAGRALDRRPDPPRAA